MGKKKKEVFLTCEMSKGVIKMLNEWKQNHIVHKDIFTQLLIT